MRRLVGVCAVIACLAGCSAASDTITDVDAPFGGVYRLRQVNQASLPLYFWPLWYPGRAGDANVQSSTMVAADLSVLSDGSFVWSTLLDEVATRPESQLLQFVNWEVRRNAFGTWSYAPETGIVSLTGLDQTGPYVLVGSIAGGVVTLSSTSTNMPKLTFVLERR